jgi:uncharacterized protein
MNATFPTYDGHDIQAVHQTCGADRAVLLCHGLASDKEARGVFTAFAPFLAGRGFDSLRFDFRGHGQSSIPPIEASVSGMMIDLAAAFAYLAERYARVHLLAASFAASVALLAARQRTLEHLASVCFWSPVTDYASTFTKSKMPWARSFFPQCGLASALDACPIAVPDRELHLGRQMVTELFSLSPASAGLPFDQPLLVIHGTEDRLVDPTDSAAFVRSHPRPNVECLLLEACGHGLKERMDDVRERTADFFQRWC